MMIMLAQMVGRGSLSSLWPLLLLVIFPMLLGLIAAWRVRSTFARASKVAASCGLSGAEVAAEIMRAHGITDVRVEESHGFLSDHYDPSHKVLRLSGNVFKGRSVASLGVAAHEAGHALQDAHGYGPLKLRSAIVPMAQAGGMAANFALMGGCLLLAIVGPRLGLPVLLLGIGGLTLVAIFQLITLPVEFDASKRAKQILTSTGLILRGEEERAMSSVLNAAALTYVAALVSTIGTILYYLLIVLSNSNRRG